MRLIVMHLKAGESIPERQNAGAIMVHCLKGNVNFSAGDEQAELTSGVLISLAANRPHSLRAQEESVLLVTLSEQTAQKPAA